MHERAPLDEADLLPPALRPARPLHNLPAPTARLIGRETERADLGALLRDPACRLITLTGVGGAGKTLLALSVAHDLLRADAPLFPHGVFLVALEMPLPRDDPDDALAIAIARALDLALSGPEPSAAQVVAFLREKRVLLLLDSGDSLRPGAAAVARLLASAPALGVLATSRERLGIAGELARPLGGLACPPEHPDRPLLAYGAAELFVHLARSVNPALALTPEAERAIGRICRLVDGLPLGVELAAGWASVLSCDEIAAELAQSLDLLASDRPDLPARHQSMRAVLDTTWEQLGPQERLALRRLSVFSGAFSRDAAAAVLGGADDAPALTPAAALPLLAGLVHKSLARREDTGGATCFRLPQPVRQYAADQLAAAGEAELAAREHMRHELGALVSLTWRLRGPEQQQALAAIDARLVDVRAAWRYAASTGASDLIRHATPALFHFYDMRSWFREGADMFAAACRGLADGGDRVALGVALARAGWFDFHLGRMAEATSALRQSLELLRASAAHAELVFPLNYLAAVTAYTGDYAGCLALAREGLELASDLGDRYGQAVAHNILGQAAYEQGDYTRAWDSSAHSLAIEQEIGNRWSMAFSLTNLGKVACATRALDEAQRLFRQSLDIRRDLRDLRGVAICLSRLGDTAAALREPLEAADHYEQSYRLSGEIGNQWGMAAALFNLGRLAHAQDELTAATRLLQEALHHALAAQARPQVTAILQSLGQLAPHEGWQRELASLATNVALDRDAPEVMRRLAWATRPAMLALDLDAALARLRDRIARAAAPAQGSERHTAAGLGELTARELEVLRLVAEGLTDAQVADKLIVSRRTVSTHLSTIYSKLQVNSRTAAVRAARDQGLLG